LEPVERTRQGKRKEAPGTFYLIGLLGVVLYRTGGVYINPSYRFEPAAFHQA
jgi:hypothetical protein